MALPKIHTQELLESVPPWLTRLFGDKLLRSFGDEIDGLATRVARAVKHRFPNVVDTSSLARVGRERRIRRGPGEDAETYATRLRLWWDMHRIRGGPYALLWNLHHFFLAWLPGRKDVVDHSGKRTWIDADGEITRDSVEWNADGSSDWAQVWVFFRDLGETVPLGTALLVDVWNNIITTLGGDAITVGYSIDLSALTDAEEEVFKAIPREWSAAHVLRTHVVLLPGDAALVGYPEGRLVEEDGQTVGRTNQPVILVIEGV